MEAIIGFASPLSVSAVHPAVEAAQTSTSASAQPNRDRYVPATPRLPAGLYRLMPDWEGNPRVAFDDPEMDTANTDRELKVLRKDAASAQERLYTEGDPVRRAGLERQATCLTPELA